VVLSTDGCSPESELVHDLLAIVNVFSGRMPGLRKYKNQIKSQIKEDRDLSG
jgi:predicted site-specific integrase-resolvase